MAIDIVMTTIVVETRHALSLRKPKRQMRTKQLGNNDGKIRGKIPFHRLLVDTRAFPCALRRRGVARKSAVTRHARRLGYQFAWQPGFYDHIIRNDAAYDRITEYIKNNPRNWQKDKFCTDKK